MVTWHPGMNREDALLGARRTLHTMEQSGPIPGQPFDHQAAIRGYKHLIKLLEGE